MTPTADFERQVAVTEGELEAGQGFEAQSHRLEVLGACPGCRRPARRV